ncbi:hypothetical protein F5I97DRAFT_1887698, partial [Phlebopus sp. FC_14]
MNTLFRLVQEIRAKRVVDKFKHQLQSYWCNEYPFNSQLKDLDTYRWWKALESHPHTRVLSSLAMKIPAVLINSMPDERTGSRLMWLNSPTCANQNAQTLVDMIQIGQWYGTLKEPRQRKPPYRPSVKSRDIDQDILDTITTGARAPATGNGASSSEAQDASDNESETDEDADDASGQTNLPEEEILRVDEDIDLDCPLLCDMIATIPVSGAEKLRTPTERSPALSMGMPDWSC